MEYLSTIRKALVPVAVTGVLAVLAYLGVGGDVTVKEAVTLLVTAVAVYIVPNSGK